MKTKSRKPITDKQRNLIIELGGTVSKGMTRREASQAISILLAAKDRNGTSFRALRSTQRKAHARARTTASGDINSKAIASAQRQLDANRASIEGTAYGTPSGRRSDRRRK